MSPAIVAGSASMSPVRCSLSTLTLSNAARYATTRSVTLLPPHHSGSRPIHERELNDVDARAWCQGPCRHAAETIGPGPPLLDISNMNRGSLPPIELHCVDNQRPLCKCLALAAFVPGRRSCVRSMHDPRSRPARCVSDNGTELASMAVMR